MDRILTTHVGSLPRPHDLLDLMKAQAADAAGSATAYGQRARTAVADCARDQAAAGIDVINDGEQSKRGFFSYVQERLDGFEPRHDPRRRPFAAERDAFPEYYEEYFRQAMDGGAVVPMVPLVCVGPVRYRAEAALQRDIDNLKRAAAQVPHADVFMTAVAPSGIGSNAYYKSDEEYFHAVGAAMRVEYQAIVDAGLLLQVDDPFLSDIFADPELDTAQKQARANLYVEAINDSLKGIAPERVRLHTCYGINQGPRIHDAPLAEIVPHMLKVNAGTYSFEAGNPRHEHEYRLWDTVKLPPGKKLMPGVITHASNIVEHPELIAERLVRFATRVGRENVIASADCGFSSQASYRTEVHPTVVWAKFRALAEGARIASRQLW